MKQIKNKYSLKIISYNLHYHRANTELSDLVKRYDADVLCLQECYADQLPEQIEDLELADTTSYGKFNMAIYCRSDRFAIINTQSHVLQDSVLERIYMPRMERLLVSRLHDRDSNQHVSIGSFHATHLIATNYLRRNQIVSAHQKLSELSNGSPAIMVGDYNYPLFKRGLKVKIERSGYKMTLADRPTYYLNKHVRGHFDLATHTNTEVEEVTTLPRGISDHSPILVQIAL